MARSLNSAYSFFAGIDDQQAYNLRQNEDERKRLAEERAQQDQAFAEASRAQKLQEYATNQPIRDLALAEAQAKLLDIQDPTGIATRKLAKDANYNAAIDLAKYYEAKRGVVDVKAAGVSAGNEINAIVKQKELDTSILSKTVEEKLNTFANGDKTLMNLYAAQLANAPTKEEKQALSNKFGLNVVFGDNTFTVGASTLPIPNSDLYKIVTSPATGEAAAGASMMASAAAAQKFRIDQEAAIGRAAVQGAQIESLKASALAKNVDAAATEKVNNQPPSGAPQQMAQKPGSTAAAPVQKPLTPAEQEQQKLAFDAAARLATLKAASAEADAKASEARNKLLRLKQSLTAPPQDVQAASLEYNRLSKLADAERAKVK
jgi:hypothetical protein